MNEVVRYPIFEEIRRKWWLVRRITAQDETGRLAYYVVFVRESRLEEFEAVMRNANGVDLREYGIILACCYGQRLTDDMKKRLFERYGVLG